MFVYLINILSICLYALFFCRGRNAELKISKILFLVLAFTQCAVISIMRSNIGTDYVMYFNGFKEMAQSGFSNMKHEDWEIGYILLNKIIGIFTDRAAVLFAVTTIISLAGPFYLILRYSKNYFMSVFLFLNTYLFYLTMNYIRQGIAMSIMCFAYGFMKNCDLGNGKKLWKDKNMWLFLLLVAVAATFHLPVVYMIPVFFISFIKLNWKTLPIYAVGLIVYFATSDFILDKLLSHFHQEYADSRFINNGIAFYYAIIPLIICVAMIALAFFLKFKLSRSLNLLLHLTLMMGFWQIVMTKHALFERFSYYTMIYLIIAVPEAIYAFKEKLVERSQNADTENSSDLHESKKIKPQKHAHFAECSVEKKSNRIVVAVSSAVLVLMFAYNMLGLIVPKYGAHGVLPYKSIYNLSIPDIDGWFKR